MGIAHLDEVQGHELEVGHLQATWSFLGEAAGAVGVGVTPDPDPGRAGWSTPAHDHGVEEELFYVLGGRGLSWHKGETFEVAEGDCILYPPRQGPPLAARARRPGRLAFGPASTTRARGSRGSGRRSSASATPSAGGLAVGLPIQFVREAELGPPELPEPGPRPSTIVNLRDVEPSELARPRIQRTRRNFGKAVGSVTTGLQHVESSPGMPRRRSTATRWRRSSSSSSRRRDASAR